jgi:hypothetical protein
MSKFLTCVAKYGNITTITSSEHQMTKIKNQNGTYPNIHKITNNGRRIIYSTKQHTLQNKPKLFINEYGKQYIYYDKNGKYGFTEAQIIIIEPAPITIIFIKSLLFQLLCSSTKIIGNHAARHDISNYIPNFSTNVKTIDDIYKELNITKEEIKIIEQYNIPTFKDVDVLYNTPTTKTKKKPRNNNNNKSNNKKTNKNK